MKLAILITNTDESDFSLKWPQDGEKFSNMITLVRPEWNYEVFLVKDNIFPNDISEFDGFIIGGSPASVHDDLPWIGKLLTLIQQIYTAKIPLFGACFGHQAIALALGGKVERNPQGWGHGLIENKVISKPPWVNANASKSYSLYASHIDQVSRLPKDAIAIATSNNCKTSSYRVGTTVFTTQHHPEMSHDFFNALVFELSDYVGQSNTQKAQESLKNMAHNLELCQRALNEYLDMKKKIFPRFYFVSNIALLDMLSNGNDPPKIMKHLGT